MSVATLVAFRASVAGVRSESQRRFTELDKDLQVVGFLHL